MSKVTIEKYREEYANTANTVNKTIISSLKELLKDEDLFPEGNGDNGLNSHKIVDTYVKLQSVSLQTIPLVLDNSFKYLLLEDSETKKNSLLDAQIETEKEKKETVKEQTKTFKYQQLGYEIDASVKVYSNLIQAYNVSYTQSPDATSRNSSNKLDDPTIGDAYVDMDTVLYKFSTL